MAQRQTEVREMLTLTLKEKQAFLIKVKTNYANLRRRIYGAGEQSLWGDVKDFSRFILLGEQVGFPSKEEIERFIKLVNGYKPKQYEASDENDPLKTHREQASLMYKALRVQPALLWLEKKICRELDWQNLDLYERKLNKIIKICEREKLLEYFKATEKSHPYHLDTYHKKCRYLAHDISELNNIKPWFEELKQRIEQLNSEKEKVTKQQFASLIEHIRENFKQRSLRERLREEVQALNKTQSSKIDDIKQKINGMNRSLAEWQEKISNANSEADNYLSNQNKPLSLFPVENKYLIRLKQLNQKLDELNKQWPDLQTVAINLLPLIEAHQQKTEQLLSLLEQSLQQKINSNESADSLLPLFKHYQAVLKRMHKIDDKRELLEEFSLNLFRKAYQQQLNKEWFSFFRRSYWKSHVFSWQAIQAHVQGENKYYSGYRTKSVLISLGWFSANGELTDDAIWLKKPQGMEAESLRTSDLSL